jgi:hypothetical protein
VIRHLFRSAVGGFADQVKAQRLAHDLLGLFQHAIRGILERKTAEWKCNARADALAVAIGELELTLGPGGVVQHQFRLHEPTLSSPVDREVASVIDRYARGR